MDRRAAIFFALSSLFFGGTFVAAKAGLEYFPPLLFVALRFDVAAVLLGGYVLLTSSREELLPSTRGDFIGILATGGLVIGLANALLFVGQQYATSAVGAIVFSLNPILTPRTIPSHLCAQGLRFHRLGLRLRQPLAYRCLSSRESSRLDIRVRHNQIVLLVPDTLVVVYSPVLYQ